MFSTKTYKFASHIFTFLVFRQIKFLWNKPSLEPKLVLDLKFLGPKMKSMFLITPNSFLPNFNLVLLYIKKL